MTPEGYILLVVLLGMVGLFITEKISPDLAALVALIFLCLSGLLTSKEAFSGFSSPAALTLIPMFMIGAGLRVTGISDAWAGHIHNIAKNSEALNVIAVMLVASLVSSFMNNVAATALLLPTVVGLSRRSGVSVTRLLIPLSFATLLGGTITLIGTAPNIVGAQILAERTVESINFASFLPFGIAIVLFGISFMVLVGRHLLPSSTNKEGASHSANLAELYRLQERMFSLRVPIGSSLHGRTLNDVHFGESLDVGVVAMVHQGVRTLAPGPSKRIFAGDVLVVGGRQDELELLLKFKGVRVLDLDRSSLEKGADGLIERSFRLTKNEEGKFLKDLNLKSAHGVLVVAFERKDEVVFNNLPSQKLCEGDILHLIGKSEILNKLSELYEAVDVPSVLDTEKVKDGGLFALSLPSDSKFAGITIKDSRIGELTGITLLAIIRGGKFELVSNIDSKLRAGDQIVASGDRRKIESLADLGQLELIKSEDVSQALESETIGLMEAVLSPRSRLINRTLTDIRFRERYDMQVLAVWHEGKPMRARFAKSPLKFGDALLLQGPRSKMSLISQDPDFVVLSDEARLAQRPERSTFAVIGVLLLVALSASGIVEVEIAAWTAALVLLLSGVITIEEGYREIDWRVVILVSAVLPIGTAFEHAGFTTAISNFLFNSAGIYGFPVVMVALCLITSLISQLLDGALAVVIMTPLAITISQHYGVSAVLPVMCAILSSSNAFLTPFSHRAHLLVMGVAGYRTRDYLRVGLWMTLVYFAAMISVISLYKYF